MIDFEQAPRLACSYYMKTEFLYLDQSAVLSAGVLDMPRAMRVVGEALAQFSAGTCRQPHKVVLRSDDSPSSEDLGRYNGLFASVGVPARAVGMKWIASFPANRSRGLPRASALAILNHPDNGLPAAVMDATLLSAVRTGAVTALGARHLAPRKTRKVGVVGAGVQAHTQILGLFSCLPNVEEIAVWNRTPERAEVLAGECRERWQAPMRLAPSAGAALADADVALTITTSSHPLMRACHIKPGALTIQLSGHECEFEVINQCGKIVTDDWEVLKHRGIITPAIMHAQGLLDDDRIYASLGEILLGRKPGREDDSERIHFAHMGMGICDVALAWDVYRTACSQGLGQVLKLWDAPLWV
jgi:N-[(2S)-2-amino-2-carboxyethyl]-L-glutamate dehydrogenase